MKLTLKETLKAYRRNKVLTDISAELSSGDKIKTVELITFSSSHNDQTVKNTH